MLCLTVINKKTQMAYCLIGGTKEELSVSCFLNHPHDLLLYYRNDCQLSLWLVLTDP